MNGTILSRQSYGTDNSRIFHTLSSKKQIREYVFRSEQIYESEQMDGMILVTKFAQTTDSVQITDRPDTISVCYWCKSIPRNKNGKIIKECNCMWVEKIRTGDIELPIMNWKNGNNQIK
jgi:hypothetical protein